MKKTEFHDKSSINNIFCTFLDRREASLTLQWRWMGTLRFSLYALFRIIRPREYSGTPVFFNFTPTFQFYRMRCCRSDCPGLFFLLLSTLVCCQPTELILGFFCFIIHLIYLFYFTPAAVLAFLPDSNDLPDSVTPIASFPVHHLKQPVEFIVGEGSWRERESERERERERESYNLSITPLLLLLSQNRLKSHYRYKIE